MTRTNTNMSRYVYLTLTLSTCYISCTVQQSRKVQVGNKINDLHCAKFCASVHQARACRQYDVRENRHRTAVALAVG